MTDRRTIADRLRRLAERELTVAEVHAYLNAPVADAEREEVLRLTRWFRRCYPSPADRLAYVRRAYARWRRTLGAAWSG